MSRTIWLSSLVICKWRCAIRYHFSDMYWKHCLTIKRFIWLFPISNISWYIHKILSKIDVSIKHNYEKPNGFKTNILFSTSLLSERSSNIRWIDAIKEFYCVRREISVCVLWSKHSVYWELTIFKFPMWRIKQKF